MLLEGRVAVGLDEFMLRLGHLKVLAALIPTMTASRQRVVRRLADELVKPVNVTSADIPYLGEYLAQKHLAVVVSADGDARPPHPKARYKELRVCLDEAGRAKAIESLKREPVTVWFQDKAIADPRTTSKVGAVTVEVREITNKSGVSHLVDWASILGITNARLALTSHGRVLSALSTSAEITQSQNPYVVGPERIAFAWFLFATDGDILRRLVERLSASTDLTKTSAIDLIIDISSQIQRQAVADRGTISSRAVRGIRSLQEDLGLGRGSGTARKGESHSTAWHRISSRLESLTDLGLLKKLDSTGHSRQFDYYYRPTAALLALNNALQTDDPVLDVLQRALVSSIFGSTLAVGSSSDYGNVLFDAIRLAVTPTGVHIESCALAASTIAAARGKLLEIGSARERITNLAHTHSEVARLSRGYSGTRPEFLSLSVPLFDKLGPQVFQ